MNENGPTVPVLDCDPDADGPQLWMTPTGELRARLADGRGGRVVMKYNPVVVDRTNVWLFEDE